MSPVPSAKTTRPLATCSFYAVAILLLATSAASFLPVIPAGNRMTRHHAFVSSPLLAKKKQKSKKSGGIGSGGGFGSSKAPAKGSVNTISADKNSLEKQWDAFVSITELEIFPRGDPGGEDYRHFEVCDVFVRVGGSKDGNTSAENAKEGRTKWFRIGKVCAADDIDISAALTLHKGLIFWTAVHMRRELVAAGGKSGAALLELGYVSPASTYMAAESDGPLDEEEEAEVQTLERTASVDLQGVSIKNIGFRPDYNPPGFTFKRREKAAMKKKKS